MASGKWRPFRLGLNVLIIRFLTKAFMCYYLTSFFIFFVCEIIFLQTPSLKAHNGSQR